MLDDVPTVLARLRWARERRIWPNGLRYLWTDAFGVVLLVSLYRALRDEQYLDQAEWVVGEVDRVLGRPEGIRIGEAPDRDGQYFHYLARWLFALACLGRLRPRHTRRAITLAQTIHRRFVIPGVGVIWKMREDLSGPYPGYGMGAIDAFHGYVLYRLFAPDDLAGEIAEMAALVERSYPSLHIAQDLGLGIMLWLTHFSPGELGRRCSGSGHSPRSTGCGWILRVISAVSPDCRTSSSPSRTTASRSDCNPWAPVRTAWNG